MPTSCRIDKQEGIIYVEHVGQVDLESFVQFVIDLTGDPDFSPQYRVLSDLRQIVYRPRVSEAIDFGSFLGTLHALLNEKIAAVLPDPLHYQLSRIVCLMARARGIDMRSFQDLESARAWLLADADQAGKALRPRTSESTE